jgi:hypothetical protein
MSTSSPDDRTAVPGGAFLTLNREAQPDKGNKKTSKVIMNFLCIKSPNPFLQLP